MILVIMKFRNVKVSSTGGHELIDAGGC